MTLFSDRNPRRGISEVDDLDDFLNHLVAPNEPSETYMHHVGAAGSEELAAHDANRHPSRSDLDGLSPLATSASEFHRRMEAAQDQHAQASHPEPDVWDRILGSQIRQEKEFTMSPTPLLLNNRPTGIHGVPPATRGVTRGMAGVGKWLSTLAAVLLIVAIGAGYWFSGIGPGGGGSDDSPRYAVQGVTPRASPEASGVGCDVEPLTVDEVMARISDPGGWIQSTSGEQLPFLAGPLSDATQLIVLNDQDWLEIPDEPDFESMSEITNQYTACLLSGSVGQMWSLLSPHMLQTQIFGRFPVFRAEEAVRLHVEESINSPAFTYIFPSNVWKESEIEAIPDSQQSRLYTSQKPFVFGYVPTRGISDDGEVLVTSSWNDQVQVIIDTHGPPPTLGAVTLVKYPNLEQWFVHDAIINREGPAATPAQ